MPSGPCEMAQQHNLAKVSWISGPTSVSQCTQRLLPSLSSMCDSQGAESALQAEQSVLCCLMPSGPCEMAQRQNLAKVSWISGPTSVSQCTQRLLPSLSSMCDSQGAESALQAEQSVLCCLMPSGPCEMAQRHYLAKVSWISGPTSVSQCTQRLLPSLSSMYDSQGAESALQAEQSVLCCLTPSGPCEMAQWHNLAKVSWISVSVVLPHAVWAV